MHLSPHEKMDTWSGNTVVLTAVGLTALCLFARLGESFVWLSAPFFLSSNLSSQHGHHGKIFGHFQALVPWN